MPPLDAAPDTGEADLPKGQSRAVADAVREALARRRMSRQALADAARISLSTLEKALSGRRPFTLATTIRLEEALATPLRQAPPRREAAPRPAPSGVASELACRWFVSTRGCWASSAPTAGWPGRWLART